MVSIEAREAEVFYSGGFLPPGEHVLPRDYDLDVVKAISAIGGPLVNGGVNANNLSGSIAEPGLGSFSPKLVSVLRKTPNGGLRHHRRLNCALRNPRENLILKAGRRHPARDPGTGLCQVLQLDDLPPQPGFADYPDESDHGDSRLSGPVTARTWRRLDCTKQPPAS